MKIEELEQEAIEDLTLDETNIRLASIFSVRKKIKWLRYLYDVEEELSEIEGRYNSLYKVVYKKVRQDSNLLIDKKDIDKSINADPDIILAKKVMNERKHCLEFIESIIKSFETVNFAINNYIKVKQFEECI